MRQHHRYKRESPLTDEQRDAAERGIVDLGKKQAKAKAPWIAEAHRHSAAVLQELLDKNPRREPDAGT